MSWKPTTNQETRQLRAKMNRDIREFFHQRDVLEVETPALSQAGNTDPYIQSFQMSSKPSQRYLHTSPEYPMKRLLAAGSGDIYQICKVWREEESGRNHNPEFTLLEWYRVGFTYQQLMQEVSELLHSLFSQLPSLLPSQPPHQQLPQIKQSDKSYTYEQLFLEKFGINPHIASYGDILNCVISSIPSLDAYTLSADPSNSASNDLDRQALLDALLSYCIEPDFDKDCLTFVYDYPVSQSALAKISEGQNDGKPPVAMRFEVYLGQKELGNGYQEETNHQRNTDILKSENKQRQKTGLKDVTIDKHFLDAAESGIPESAGVAIGLDRVLMAIAKEDSIQKVINFPWDVA